MRKFISSPLVRISFGLMMLTVAMLLITDILGLVPDTREADIRSRKVISESLAVQLSTEIADRKLNSINEILRSVVERNENVLSAAIRKNSGGLLAEFGGHDRNWKLQPSDRSTATQVQVPLFSGQSRWGNVELHFTALADDGSLFAMQHSFTAVILFMALVGFLAYLLFLKRTMRELNPDSVIPERVRKALDTLAEGLLILNHEGYIVFSNLAFIKKIGIEGENLVGKQSSEFNWEIDSRSAVSEELPWVSVLEGRSPTKGIMIRLKTDINEHYTFTVNVSPITATAGKIRGALVTFDDITEIEIKNEELIRTLDKLEQSKREVTRQNQELQVLATRDPLTDVLNRRSLFQGLETLFSEAREEGEPLSCIMVDIDHFKSVNDRFGHAVGDKVIKFLAKILIEHSRSNDLVGRYGGEEFCIVLPGADSNISGTIAERMRLAMQEGTGAKFSTAVRVTSSFGISSLTDAIRSAKEIVDQADKALYAAKERGRNRVICWSSTLQEEVPEKKISNLPVDGEKLEASSDHDGQFAEDGREPEHKLSKVDLQGVESSWRESSYMSHSVLLFDRIDQAIKRCVRQDTQIAVLVVDIDKLQRAIDTLGLAVGEKITRIIVTRLKQTLRLTDIVTLSEQDELLFSVSRGISNEIVVLLTDLKHNEIVTGILQRILSTLNEPVEVEGHEIYINATVGVSVFPLDGDSPEALIRNAGSAMRAAKQELGESKFRFYGDDINQCAIKNIKLEAELYRALEREELVVHYQPKVDLNTGSILGMEALVRWKHAQLGILQPNEFIPLAEQTGLIEDIGHLVMRTACRQVRSWQAAGYGVVKVAVNLSPVEFRNPDLGNQIIDLVNEFSIQAGAFELEITETVVMQSMDTAVATLEKLSNAGFTISLDDFGTGYSSLSYLKRFPINKVKIDRSFISGLMQGSNDAAIVSAIIAMSHSMGLTVVAEGVETDEQLRFLQDLHCDEMQGNLVSRPVPRETASELLARAPDIRRMILDYGINYVELMKFQGSDLITGMAGVLSDFPVQGKG